MKKILFIAVAAIAALSSCSNNDEFEPKQTGKQGLVFTATMEGAPETRATYDGTDKCALWEVNDEISINGKKYKAQSAGTATTFTADEGDATGETYNAYFPASLYNNGTPTLPANINETWADGKFNMPMYAGSSTLDLSFKNLCGVLKITVTNTQLASVKCITVSSTNKAVSGAFTVDDNNAAVLTGASNTANTVTVTYTDAVTTGGTGKVFYVAIPAQTYKNLSIAVSDGTTTKVMTTKKDQDITVARNTVYPIAFKPTTGTAKATIGGSEVDVNWVQLWENGPKFAEYNVGATSATDYGGYYTWGGTYNNDPNLPDFSWTDDHNNDLSELTHTGDNITDTATKLWGSKWRMPTADELGKWDDAESKYVDGLLGKCTVEWIDGTTKKYKDTDITGLLCTGKGAYASNSVFLPAAGVCDDGGVFGQGDGGDYWSSTPRDSGDAYNLDFYSGDQNVYDYHRSCGFSVRAVLAE